MLQYQTIYAVNQANYRLAVGKRDRYGWSGQNNREADTLTVFTLGQQANRESSENLDNLLKLGEKFQQSFVVFTDHKIQFLGAATTDVVSVSKNLYSDEWREEFEQWGDNKGISRLRPYAERSSQGAVTQLLTWKRCFALAKHQGVYSVKSGKKITNRREIIQNFWDFGFAALRGRPLTVATIASVGERSDLEQITELAQIYYHKRGFSEAAKKMVTNFTSLNRVAAWPGAW